MVISPGMKLSKRSLSVESSGIRRVFDLAATLENPINLSIGQPNFDAFPEVKKATIQAIEEGKSGYTQTQGIPALRKRISEKSGLSEGDGRSCFLTSGVSGGIFLAYICLLDPGDELIIPDPYFVMYEGLATLINSVPVTFSTYPDFQIRAEDIEKVITPKSKAILIGSPGNPTGASISPENLKQVVELARKHDLWLIYDEIYAAFSYDTPHSELKTDYEKVVILNGFSKSHGVPGWRVGYAVGPEPLIQQMLKVQQYSFVCAPSIAQWGLLAGLDHDFSDTLQDYREKRDLLYRELSGLYEMNKPGGAFYLFPRAPGGNASSFFEECVKHKLLVIPGGIFSKQDTHFRISFSASRSQIERGVEVLRKLAQ